MATRRTTRKKQARESQYLYGGQAKNFSSKPQPFRGLLVGHPLVSLNPEMDHFTNLIAKSEWPKEPALLISDYRDSCVSSNDLDHAQATDKLKKLITTRSFPRGLSCNLGGSMVTGAAREQNGPRYIGLSLIFLGEDQEVYRTLNTERSDVLRVYGSSPRALVY